jgi:hypothetical protein
VWGWLPATPDEAAAIEDTPFTDRVDGVYLPWDWFEPDCTGVRLPTADWRMAGTFQTERTGTGARESCSPMTPTARRTAAHVSEWTPSGGGRHT